jgi:DUF971 family protein
VSAGDQAQEGQFPKAAPDEGSYETTAPWPTELRVFKEEGRMEVEFSDGVTHSLPAEYLRVESPSAEVQGHNPSQKQLVHGRAHVGILAVEPVGNYALRIKFDDLHDTGIYSWTYLYKLGIEQEQRWRAYLDELKKRGVGREPERGH